MCSGLGRPFSWQKNSGRAAVAAAAPSSRAAAAPHLGFQGQAASSGGGRGRRGSDGSARVGPPPQGPSERRPRIPRPVRETPPGLGSTSPAAPRPGARAAAAASTALSAPARGTETSAAAPTWEEDAN